MEDQETKEDKLKDKLVQNLPHLQALSQSKKKRKYLRLDNILKTFKVTTTLSKALKKTPTFAKKILTKKKY